MQIMAFTILLNLNWFLNVYILFKNGISHMFSIEICFFSPSVLLILFPFYQIYFCHHFNDYKVLCYIDMP